MRLERAPMQISDRVLPFSNNPPILFYQPLLFCEKNLNPPFFRENLRKSPPPFLKGVGFLL